MKTNRFTQYIHYFYCLLFICVMLSTFSCSPQGDNTYAGGGIGGTGVVSSGTVTAIGSVWVNGIEYDTADAEIYINDVLAGTGDQTVLDNLNPGHVVVVNGNIFEAVSGQADSVSYFSTLLGPVSEIVAINDYDRVFTILNQTVVVTGGTVVMGNLNDFSVGNLVEVSGYIDNTDAADVKIQASYISKKSDVSNPDDLLRVTGIISNLVEVDQTFNINSLGINYADAELEGTLQDGLWVHASGYLKNGNPVFSAAQISPYKRLGDSDGLEVELEGIVGSDISDNVFSFEGYLVEVTGSTVIIGGSAAEIVSGARIEVEGTLAGETLVAGSIKFRTSFKAESDLAEKDEINNTLTLSGLAELDISVNEITKYNGLNSDFGELTVGDHITVRGWMASDDVLMATQVTSTAVGNKVSVQGSVSEINASSLTLGTIEIDTDLVDEFFTEDEALISQEDFLDVVQTGDTVEAKGQLIGDAVDWSALTLQSP